jgi:hypothetical protein
LDKTYTLFLHDGSGAPPAFEICVCSSPEEARQAALKLLSERPRYKEVEVSDALTSFMVERSEA